MRQSSEKVSAEYFKMSIRPKFLQVRFITPWSMFPESSNEGKLFFKVQMSIQ